MQSYQNRIDRAQMLWSQERLDLAEESLTEAIAEDPDRGIAYSILSLIKSDQSHADAATDLAERGIALDPDESYAHYALSVVMSKRKKLADADRAIASAIELEPTQPAYHAQRSLIALMQSRWSDAIDYAETGLQFDPSHVQCNNLRAIALNKTGRRDEAGVAIESVLQKSPEDPASHANLGWTRLHEGRPVEAADHFREALRLEPNNQWAREGIIESLKARNLFYRQVLRYMLWVSRFSPRAQLLAFIGIIVILQILVRMPDGSALQIGGVFLALAYMMFVGSMWLASPVFDLLLRFSRYGRLALTDERRSDTNYLLVAMAVVAVLLAGPLVTGFRPLDVIDYAILMIPVAVMLATSRKAKRKQAAIAVVAIFAVACFYWYRWYIDTGIDGLSGAYAIMELLETNSVAAADAAPDDRIAPLLDLAKRQEQLNQLFLWPAVLMSWASGYFANDRT